MNTFQNQNRNYNQQYSPGSQYKYDEGENAYMSSSMHFNRSQKAVNIDDIPIPATKAKTFEELLEANLRQIGEDANDAID
jgi:hypothetical protein